jgi:hypothetical protein
MSKTKPPPAPAATGMMGNFLAVEVVALLAFALSAAALALPSAPDADPAEVNPTVAAQTPVGTPEIVRSRPETYDWAAAKRPE